MLPFAKLSLVLGFLVGAPLAFAQDTLGALLDANATKVSAEQFKKDLMQRTLVGPTPAGGRLEVIYTGNGEVAGTGTLREGVLPWGDSLQILGKWTIDAPERICTSMVFSLQRGGPNANLAGGYLPPRCQYWYKLGDQYFLSDSDSDRSAKVLSRTVK